MAAQQKRRFNVRRAVIDPLARSTTVKHIKQRDLKGLGKHMGKNVVKAERTLVTETRDRHSLVSLAAPNDVDGADARHLRDEQVSPIFVNCRRVILIDLLWPPLISCDQVSQIFFNCLVTELMVVRRAARAPTPDSQRRETECQRNLLLTRS